jgi:hypothetical protein
MIKLVYSPRFVSASESGVGPEVNSGSTPDVRAAGKKEFVSSGPAF